MRDRRDTDYDHDIPYGRPAVSAWVAAAAVAFAFFVLGGFIRTYRQLESSRAESRQEIRELKLLIEGLRAAVPAESAVANSNRITPLPRARRSGSAPAAAIGFPPESETASGLSPEALLAGLGDERRRLTYSIGRTTANEARKPQCQVVAVNALQKRIMVEGGRNLGLSEGARLELSRQGRWIGDLRVLDVFDTLSSCEVLHATLTPEPGDVVRMPQ